MNGAIDSFKGKLKLWKTLLIKYVLTHLPDVRSHDVGTCYAYVYTVCVE
jgi:hypothetical protein